MNPHAANDELKALQDRCALDLDQFDAWLEQRGMSWQGLSSGVYNTTLAEAQFAFIMQDPVHWARGFLNDPDADDQPWQFFGYQEESARAWMQDAVHQDGAEVGKTREIIVLVLWAAITGCGGVVRNPSLLVGAPQQTHLDEIIMAIEEHVGEAEGQKGEKPIMNRFWQKPKKHPHYMMRFTGLSGRARVYFRPAGHDGEAFRGVHVNAMALMDEAAKLKNSVCWTEFYRALKPGCVFRAYSVPDGDRSTEYFRLATSAIPDLPIGQPGMRLFHWPKTIMPEPFWSESRARFYREMYGGTTAPGYVRNVLGEHGQAENPVFPYDQLLPNIHDVPEARTLKLVADNDRGELNVEAYRIELSQQEGRKLGSNHHVVDDARDLTPFKSKNTDDRRKATRALLREVFQPPGDGVYWAGADLGFSNDPTEIRVWRELGQELRLIMRLRAKGVTYDQQCELIYCIDELLDFKTKWGVDYGNAGTAVVQNLHALEIYANANYDERLTGFQFSSALDAVDENGELLEAEDSKGDLKPVRGNAKELATNMITSRMQRAGFAMPYDADVITDYINHTAREGAKQRIFSKDNDHVIDADRVMMLRRAFDEQCSVPDIFSTGAHVRGAA